MRDEKNYVTRAARVLVREGRQMVKSYQAPARVYKHPFEFCMMVSVDQMVSAFMM